jgi:nickel transport protein
MPAGRWAGILLAALLAGPARAHSVTETLLDAPATVVRFAWATGGPVAQAGFRLWGPGDVEPWLTGRSDRDGRVAFVPDRAGPWRLELQADPEHKVTRTIEITADRSAAAEGPWRRLGLVAGAAVAAAAGYLAGRRHSGHNTA